MSILLYGFSDAEETLLTDFFRRRHLETVCASLLSDLYQASLTQIAVSAILVSSRKKSKFTKQEKLMFDELQQSFTISTISVDGNWKPRVIDNSDPEFETLTSVIREKRGRPLRAQQRHVVSLAIEASEFSDFAPMTTPKLLNVSSGGCAFETSELWTIDELLWIRFPSLSRSACQAQVCWQKRIGDIYRNGLAFLTTNFAITEYLIDLEDAESDS